MVVGYLPVEVPAVKESCCGMPRRRAAVPCELPPDLCSGVRFLINALQTFGGDVGVDLSRRQMSMPEHFLHAAQVGAGIQQVRRVTVA